MADLRLLIALKSWHLTISNSFFCCHPRTGEGSVDGARRFWSRCSCQIVPTGYGQRVDSITWVERWAPDSTWEWRFPAHGRWLHSQLYLVAAICFQVSWNRMFGLLCSWCLQSFGRLLGKQASPKFRPHGHKEKYGFGRGRQNETADGGLAIPLAQ